MNKGESTKCRAQEAQGGALCLSDRASGRGVGASPVLWVACRSKVNTIAFPNSLPVLKRDVDILMQQTQQEHPNAAPFQVQAVADPAPFRVQQQAQPPAPSATDLVEKVAPGDVPLEVTDAQNDRLVKENALIRQKLRWIGNVRAQFSTQQALAPLDPETAEYLRKSDNIGYGEGCYRYYNFDPEWKEEDEDAAPVLKALVATYHDDGSIHIRGTVENPPDGMTLADIQPDFGGLINYESIRREGNLESGFEIIAENFNFSNKFQTEDLWFDEIQASISYCASDCFASQKVNINVYEVESSPRLIEEKDFSTKAYSAGGMCSKTTLFPREKYRLSYIDIPMSPNILLHKAEFDINIKKDSLRASDRLIKTEKVYLYGKTHPLGAIETLTGINVDNPNIRDAEYSPTGGVRITYEHSINESVETGAYSLEFRPAKIQYRIISSPSQILKIRTNTLRNDFRPKYWIYNTQELSQINRQLKAKKCGYKTPAEHTGATFRFYDANNDLIRLKDGDRLYDRNQISCSGYKNSSLGTVRAVPNQTDGSKEPIEARFPSPLTEDGRLDRNRFNDSERKIAEAFARSFDVKAKRFLFSTIDPNTVAEKESSRDGLMLLYVDRATCKHCASLPFYMNLTMPNLKILWVDSKDNCFDNTSVWIRPPKHGKTK